MRQFLAGFEVRTSWKLDVHPVLQGVCLSGACVHDGGDQKSIHRPLRSQSPKRVGSGPFGPPVSTGFGLPSEVRFSPSFDATVCSGFWSSVFSNAHLPGSSLGELSDSDRSLPHLPQKRPAAQSRHQNPYSIITSYLRMRSRVFMLPSNFLDEFHAAKKFALFD